MTKKDYQAIAAAIYQTRSHIAVGSDYTEGWQAALTAVTMRLIPIMQADNAAFSKGRFLEACETGRTKGMRQV